VQRCPITPQEKRCTSTGKEAKTPKWNKWKLNKNGHDKDKSQGLIKRDPRSYEPQAMKEIKHE
jgi:hypothetical protein